MTSDTELPFEVPAAVRLGDQADFDPVAYLDALVDVVENAGGRIHENTRVCHAVGGVVKTAEGHTIRCQRTIIATHMPFVDRSGLFARAEPKRSYSVTARVDGPVLQGMYLSAGSPTRSLRSVPRPDGELLLVGGESHRAGTDDPREHFDTLQQWGREHFPVASYEHAWAAHDFVGEDNLPYVGAATPFSDRELTVTGLKKWGLAMGAGCAAWLAESILTGEQAWPDAFDSRRVPRPHALASLARHNAESGVFFFGDRLRRSARADLAPGEGSVVRDGLSQKAVFRDDDGKLRQVSARCTHLGCLVRFNAAERTWDCPCHGSRFDVDGSVIEGPATKPLEPKD
jgi:glycine/D-amino acid oxidase-like deaminating enzyme/nitrite reductase/ring-hydroxylating ferredoxin subunit